MDWHSIGSSSEELIQMSIKESIKEIETYVKTLKKEQKLSKAEAEVANLILNKLKFIKSFK